MTNPLPSYPMKSKESYDGFSLCFCFRWQGDNSLHTSLYKVQISFGPVRSMMVSYGAEYLPQCADHFFLRVGVRRQRQFDVVLNGDGHGVVKKDYSLRTFPRLFRAITQSFPHQRRNSGQPSCRRREWRMCCAQRRKRPCPSRRSFRFSRQTLCSFPLPFVHSHTINNGPMYANALYLGENLVNYNWRNLRRI